jgi:Fe-S cluster assembly protein SufD
MNVIAQMHTAAERALLAAFNDRLGDLPGDGAVATKRDAAIEQLKTGLPTKRVEAWHYTDLRRLLTKVPDAPAGEAMPVAPLLDGSTVLTVLNGKVGKAGEIAGGVSATPIAELLRNGAFAPALGTHGYDDTVGALNAAFVSDGWFVDVPAGVELERPLSAKARKCCGSLSRISLMTRPISVSSTPDRQERQADVFVMNAGGKLVRQEIRVGCRRGRRFQLRGVNLLAGVHSDVTMVLDHAVPHTGSRELVRNVVTGKAHGVFQGRINVHQPAQKTDAKMACNTLLLSDDGEFDTKPELEIFADDVICGHGATVTEIDRTICST